MKIRIALLVTALSLFSTTYAQTEHQFPEINVSASPERVIAWFQRLVSQHGGILRSSSPSVNVFETSSQRTGYWEGIKADLNSPTGVGTGQYINRITLNTFPGPSDGLTHVILIEEKIMNYGSSFARPLIYKVGGPEYNDGVKILRMMKTEVEADNPVSTNKSGLVNWRAGEKPPNPKFE